ncbi:MAG TPA: hypothetical protein VF765_21660 [Polyangiaceae bacterium]
MPKIGVLEKTTRDRAILAGLDKLFAGRTHVTLRNERYTRASLAAKFEKHLRLMARVRQLTIARRAAITEERKEEALLRFLIRHIKKLAAAQAGGEREPSMREYGFEPDKKPTMSAHTKLVANVKRQATRKKRGIVSKKKKRVP